MVALRPTIGEAVRMLEGDMDVPELPNRPLPYGHSVMFQRSRKQFQRLTSLALSGPLALFMGTCSWDEPGKFCGLIAKSS
ncbi:hypothetical protein GQ55_2G217000 [Panicum hallii var. hallii]|uniref:Uncharacterized protein n=1 Tax=Panicum hallii var. hallii TaxID=1504633 RepID=A0A2T7ER44_9POAL|nr:hypothetical protein GQ55_2G217000 [Panicum hallii var. hallii]